MFFPLRVLRDLRGKFRPPPLTLGDPMTEPANYKDTLNLPKTTFDMKANLTQREPAMLADWQSQNLYQKIRTARAGKEKWILHDGPPYANGDIHMGHLINKVLKDIVVKFRTMQGLDSPYVPGWDCHGLPIESAIQKELGPKFRELSKEELRKKCADYARKYVKLQGDSFQRLGILGDFDHPYLTLDPKYESGILDVLAQLVSKDLVYRQKKPVHWCTNDRTALAEAELEYQNKKDTSIYVAFDLVEPSNAEEGVIHQLLIWTTTPWTLPANRAVAINPDQYYTFATYSKDGKKYNVLLGEKQFSRLVDLFPASSSVATNGAMKGSVLADLGWKYKHPLDPQRICPIVLADYVTLEDGTGLVHTAPGHGKEDYQTGLKYGLDVYNPVLPDGRYDHTVPEFLRGKSIWDANQLVIDQLKETSALFHAQQFDHEYPHCWRCKKPVIFRATEQWFVKASGEKETAVAPGGSPGLSRAATNDVPSAHNPNRPGLLPGATAHASPLWTNAKKFVDQVQWIPAWGQNRIDGMLDTRPDWCISRQRSWGVPIPAFFDEKGRTLLTAQSVARVGDYFKQHGADAWYTHTPAQLLGIDPTDQAQGLQSLGFAPDVDVTTLDKGQDILDVWFESGASHHAVLECTHPELGYPAHMYLEGSDQHRGWFQSSLLEAAGYKAEPPFKQVLTHGFVVDEKGHKMSKSEGNDIKVNDALKQYGADVLRLWVASVDYQNDIPCGPNLLKNMGEAYRKIRNTIRYLLGNLYDFNPNTDSVPPEPHSINTWMLDRAESVFRDCYTAYDTYEFHNVFKLVYEFCNVEISAIYAKAIKDRLYCELPNSPRRRAAQSLCYQLLVRLVELVAPILVFTAEEAWATIRQLPGCADLDPSVHLATIPAPLPATPSSTAKHWALLMPLVEEGNKQLDELKKSVGGKYNTSDAELILIAPSIADEVSPHIAAYAPELEDVLGVGYSKIEHGDTWAVKIHDATTRYPSCIRSWKRRPDVGHYPEYPDLSKRDAEVVKALSGK